MTGIVFRATYGEVELREMGFRAFPCAADKTPKVRWQGDPPPGGWPIKASDLIGVALPPGTVVLDIDNPETFADTGRRVPDSVSSATRREGGRHVFYRMNGRPIAQTTNPALGYDVRVGGKGYVIAWHPDDWRPVDQWAPAPEWLYEAPERPVTAAAEPEPMGTRGAILAWLGTMAAHVRIPESGYLALLTDSRASGRIVALDQARPWTDADLRKLASEAAQWEPARYGKLNGVTSAEATPPAHPGRHLRLTPASAIVARRVRWLWDGRLALGTLALIGGREGTGKTIASNSLAAQVTRGLLPGEFFGIPRNVVIVTTEDSWEMTVVPRLTAAGADPARIFRAEAVSADGVLTGLSLPHDLDGLKAALIEKEVALVILDPLLSRLDAELDTHKDAEVRLALEPLVAMAEATKASFLGLIHVNKSSTTDPLTMLMASRAFPAVARAVLFVMDDPDEQGVRLLGQPKNNLGRTDLPTLRFRVDAADVGKDPDDGRTIEAGKLTWLETTARNLTDVLAAIAAGPKRKTQTDDAIEWLSRYLGACEDGRAESSTIKDAATRAGIGEKSLRAARVRLDITTPSEGYPRMTYWQLPLGND